jgi:spore coat protein U-like protein
LFSYPTIVTIQLRFDTNVIGKSCSGSRCVSFSKRFFLTHGANMKAKQLVAILLAAGLAGTAMADTTTVPVTANVVGVCKVLTGGSVAFTLDPSVGGAVNGTITSPTFWCTKGASYAVADDDGVYETGVGARRMRHATVLTEYVPYSFSYTASGTGLGKGTPITLTLTSAVAEADYINAQAGAYADSVILTITP